MEALAWHGKREARVDAMLDPVIQAPTGVVVRITIPASCGSDLDLYEMLGPFLSEGDILGHEATGIAEEVGTEVKYIKPGDRVVVPFNISWGHCFMCSQGLQSQSMSSAGLMTSCHYWPVAKIPWAWKFCDP